MRAPAYLAVLVACLALISGCAAFGKKDSNSKTPTTGSSSGPAKFPTSSDPLLNSGSAAPASTTAAPTSASGNAVLAGRVIDNYSRPPSSTLIQVVSLDSKESKPTEVNAGPDGYFTVQGLRSGVSYKLVARGKNGEHVLAGITQTRAPNVTLVILVKEDFAGSASPDGQSGEKKKTAALDSPNSLATNPGPGGEFELPAAVSVPDPVKPPPASVDPSLAADKWSPFSPTLEIPNPTNRPSLPPLQIQTPALPPVSPNASESRLNAPARVPSCVRVGSQIMNFALNDVNGVPWEFKRNGKGKLTLIDFWATWCIPCRETVPSLAKLQTWYGDYGFEVIGIALERSGTPEEQGYAVSSMATKLKANYRQLLSSGENCPVVAGLRVNEIPTMVLLDQDGRILWTHNQKPNPATLRELERLIRQRLHLPIQ